MRKWVNRNYIERRTDTFDDLNPVILQIVSDPGPATGSLIKDKWL
jgi:hypothetical protein